MSTILWISDLGFFDDHHVRGQVDAPIAILQQGVACSYPHAIYKMPLQLLVREFSTLSTLHSVFTASTSFFYFCKFFAGGCFARSFLRMNEPCLFIRFSLNGLWSFTLTWRPMKVVYRGYTSVLGSKEKIPFRLVSASLWQNHSGSNDCCRAHRGYAQRLSDTLRHNLASHANAVLRLLAVSTSPQQQ